MLIEPELAIIDFPERMPWRRCAVTKGIPIGCFLLGPPFLLALCVLNLIGDWPQML